MSESNEFEASIPERIERLSRGRLEQGREEYGEWKPLEDGRDYLSEIEEELIDGLHYVQALRTVIDDALEERRCLLSENARLRFFFKAVEEKIARLTARITELEANGEAPADSPHAPGTVSDADFRDLVRAWQRRTGGAVSWGWGTFETAMTGAWISTRDPDTGRWNVTAGALRQLRGKNEPRKAGSS